MSLLQIKAPPSTSNWYAIQSKMTESLDPPIAKKLGQYFLIEFRRSENGTPTLKLISRAGRRPYFSLTKNRDGTLRTDPGYEHFPLTGDKAGCIRDFTRKVLQQMAAATLSSPRYRNILLGLIAHNLHEQAYDALSKWANRTTAHALRLSVLPSKTTLIPTYKVNSAWNRLIRTYFTDPVITALASKTMRHEKDLTASQYNFFLRNRDFITANQEDQKLLYLVRFFLFRIPGLCPDTVITSKNQFTSLIGHLLDIPEHQHRHIPTIVRYSYLMYKPKVQVASTAQLLDQLPAWLPTEKLEHIAHDSIKHADFYTAGGQIWDQWTEAVRQYAVTQAVTQNDTVLERTAATLYQSLPPTPVRQYHQPTPAPYSSSELEEYISDQAATELTHALPTWVQTVATQTRNTRTLKIIVDQQGRAAHTITRNPDGTITQRSKTYPHHPDVFLHKPQLQSLVVNNIAHQLLDKTRKRFPAHLAFLLSNDTIGPLAAHARDRAERIAFDTLDSKRLQDLQHMVANTNDAIRTHLIDSDTIRLTKSLFDQHGKQSPSNLFRLQYNTVALNISTFRQLVQTGQQTPLRYYFTHLHRFHTPIKLNHPGEIIAAVREKLGFNKQQWRYFCRAAHITADHRPNSQQIKEIALGSVVKSTWSKSPSPESGIWPSKKGSS